MRKMSLEERKKWYEDHLEQTTLRTWHGMIDTEVYCAKRVAYNEIIPNEIFLKNIIDDVENLISQEYYGSAITEQTLCKQEWLGCDLTELHSEIKDNDYETLIICLIKDKQIIKKFISKGKAQRVTINYDFDDIIKEAKELKADGIYDVHNHPFRLVAWPGRNDAYCASKEERKALDNNIPFNYGVVSCEDYWDYAQMGISKEEIIRIGREQSQKEFDAAEGKKLTSIEIAHKLKETADNK